ncbi:FAD-dependent oxidoreductase [Actinokineospora sp. 24-640]
MDPRRILRALHPGRVDRFRAGPAPPVGPLHWACTETAIHWNGYCDGAVESGCRAATEVHHTLSR